MMNFVRVLVPGEMALGVAIILNKTKEVFANVSGYSCYFPGTETHQSTHKYHCH